MKIGINLPQTTAYDLASDVTTFAREAERLGYDSLWAYDRVLTPQDQSGSHGLYGMPGVPWPERYAHTTDPLVTLTLAAAVTERVELGTGVLVAPLHLPVRLARMLAALDVASGGRLIAGLGAGWSIDEFEATAPRPIGERGAALDEFLDVAAAVWGPDPVAYDNGRYRIAPARINPKPARRIPVLLGGFGEPALRRVARRADGWLPTGLPPAEVGRTLTRLREMAAAHGRDPYALRGFSQVGVAGPADLTRVADDVAALAEVGVEHVYVTLPSATRDLAELLEAAARLIAELGRAGQDH
ncbi:TIGR03619 family F420-dependent LLM class oxidoreductase [Actinoplanes sp. URMC 104]|uniref:TIGR03619 family F420-dependent LLM class oxidoreductase n=1 Tax=Actinoplanes sp. URMC 104 TaxID=3423409 RepID=UPI003F19FB67